MKQQKQKQTKKILVLLEGEPSKYVTLGITDIKT